MGPFRISWVGLGFLLALLVPNLLWTRYPPQGCDPSIESRGLRVLERVGQVWVTCAALVLPESAGRPPSPWSWWLIAAVGVMILYEFWWVRYFRGERTLANFTAGLLGIPVAGAALPVLAFFLLGIYRRAVWMLLGVLVLGIGHIGIHLQHRKRARKDVR